MLIGVRWNKHINDFVSIPGVSSYDDERRSIILQSRKEVTHNFNLHHVNVTYFEVSYNTIAIAQFDVM